MVISTRCSQYDGTVTVRVGMDQLTTFGVKLPSTSLGFPATLSALPVTLALDATQCIRLAVGPADRARRPGLDEAGKVNQKSAGFEWRQNGHSERHFDPSPFELTGGPASIATKGESSHSWPMKSRFASAW